MPLSLPADRLAAPNLPKSVDEMFMPSIKIIAFLTVIFLYIRWEIRRPYTDYKTGEPGTVFQRCLPFLGFLMSAVLVQLAIILDSRPISFILLALGAFTLLAATIYGVYRRIRGRSRRAR